MQMTVWQHEGCVCGSNRKPLYGIFLISCDEYRAKWAYLKLFQYFRSYLNLLLTNVFKSMTLNSHHILSG